MLSTIKANFTTVKENFNETARTVIENINARKNVFYTLLLLLVLIIIFYLISENYRTSKVLYKMNIYDTYMNVTNSDFTDKTDTGVSHILSDYYVASSFRSVIGENQRFDYCSVEILKKILKAGARFLWFDIYNSDLTSYAEPVVSNGIKEGNWKLTLNTVPFEECCKIIGTYAFKSGRVNNYNDPLILALNLNTNNNLHSLKKIKQALVKYLGNNLLGIQFNYKNMDISKLEMKKIAGTTKRSPKVLIFASEGFVNSELEELINYSWVQKSLKKINNKSIDPSNNDSIVKEDPVYITNFNKSGLSIVVPDEDTILTRQYSPVYGWNTGCQFVAINYQQIDDNLDKYVQKFRQNSFILKPPNLRGSIYKKQNVQEIEQQKNFENENKSLFSKCSVLNE